MTRVVVSYRYVLIICISFLPVLGLAEFFTLASNRYPYIYLTNPVFPVVWHTKFFALRQSSSQAIQISARGIRFIPAAYCTVALNQNNDNMHGSLGVLQAGGTGDLWNVDKCMISRESLCKLSTQSDIVSHLFPNKVLPLHPYH
jgi:hypothetical protein